MGRHLLKAAAALSFAVALLHVGIVFAGAPAYRYFGAGKEIATATERGSPLPALITLLLSVVFAVFGLYALSGAGTIRRLPLLPLALIAIGSLYTLRGLAVFGDIYNFYMSLSWEGQREIVFSLVSLVIGLLYVAGTATSWRALREERS